MTFATPLAAKQGRRQPVRGAVEREKKKFGPPSKGGPAKSEGLTLSYKMTWAWFERANLYSRQIMIIRRNTKTCAT
jgi:hypothetical protein